MTDKEDGGKPPEPTPEEQQSLQLQQMMLAEVSKEIAAEIRRMNPAVAERVAAEAAFAAVRAHHAGALNQPLADAEAGSKGRETHGGWRLNILKRKGNKLEKVGEVATSKDLTEVAKDPGKLLSYLLIYSALTHPAVRAFLLAHGYDMGMDQVKTKSKLLL